MDAKHYVITWVQRANSPDDTLLVLKDKPAWQKGLLNLPGGKVEEGETPEQAAVREIIEESGYEPIFPARELGFMQDGSNVIHCTRVIITDHTPPRPHEGETQQILWMKWWDAVRDPRLIPNLRVIIPLLRTGVEGWIIGDTYRGTGKPRHTISISLPTWGDSCR